MRANQPRPVNPSPRKKTKLVPATTIETRPKTRTNSHLQARGDESVQPTLEAIFQLLEEVYQTNFYPKNLRYFQRHKNKGCFLALFTLNNSIHVGLLGVLDATWYEYGWVAWFCKKITSSMEEYDDDQGSLLTSEREGWLNAGCDVWKGCFCAGTTCQSAELHKWIQGEIWVCTACTKYFCCFCYKRHDKRHDLLYKRLPF